MASTTVYHKYLYALVSVSSLTCLGRCGLLLPLLSHFPAILKITIMAAEASWR